MKPTTKIPEDKGLEHLFCHAESASGVRSSYWPLIMIALGGVAGSRDPEAMVTDQRFGYRGAVGEVVKLRRALSRLESRHAMILVAAYGPEDWRALIDAAFGRGMGAKVVAQLGDLAGVSLLTEAAQRGYARDRGLEAQRATSRGWGTVGGWVVGAVLRARQDGGGGDIRRVAGEASMLFAEALTAWNEAKCQEGGLQPTEPRRRRAPVRVYHAPQVRQIAAVEWML